jgi:glycosyltransferase involved in cell wall biosynthesis
MEFEYLSMFVISFLYPKKFKKTVCVFHTADFGWVRGRSIVINLYKILARQVIRSVAKQGGGIAVHGAVIKRGIEDIIGNKYKDRVFISGYGFNYMDEECCSTASRQKLGLPLNRKIFLMFGLIRKDKGFPSILENFSHENVRDSILLLAGALQDVTQAEIDETIKKYKLEDTVIFKKGFIKESDVANYFCSCDYVFLSHQEHFNSFSGPLALSMQHKKPVISSFNWQVSSIVEGNNLGYIYKDKQSLSKILKKATEIDYKYNSSGIDFYSWDSAALRIKDWFDVAKI